MFRLQSGYREQLEQIRYRLNHENDADHLQGKAEKRLLVHARNRQLAIFGMLRELLTVRMRWAVC